MHRIYKPLFLCSLIVLCKALSAQPFKRGNFALGLAHQTQLLGKSTAFENIYGINASYFLTDRWSMEYSISYVVDPFGPNYFKLYGGGAVAGFGAIYASNNNFDDGYWALLLLTAVIPEGVSYHIPINDNVAISPYVNLLTVDLSSTYWRMSNTLGARVNLVVKDKLNLAPFAYTTVQYRGNSVGGSVGGFGVGATARWVF